MEAPLELELEFESEFVWLEASTRHLSICRQLGNGGLQFKKALDNTDADTEAPLKDTV